MKLTKTSFSTGVAFSTESPEELEMRFRRDSALQKLQCSYNGILESGKATLSIKLFLKGGDSAWKRLWT
jgi:hypothetical protein